jgi:multicomponent Na+:H+ antiporter subunit D
VGVALVVSLLTLFSMAKIWNGVFWGTTEGVAPAGGPSLEPRRRPVLMNGATIALVGLTLAIALFAGPLYDLCLRAAETLVDPSGYVTAVMGR